MPGGINQTIGRPTDRSAEGGVRSFSVANSSAGMRHKRKFVDACVNVLRPSKLCLRGRATNDAANCVVCVPADNPENLNRLRRQRPGSVRIHFWRAVCARARDHDLRPPFQRNCSSLEHDNAGPLLRLFDYRMNCGSAFHAICAGFRARWKPCHNLNIEFSALCPMLL